MERLSWVVVVATAAGYLGVLVSRSLSEAAANPIATAITSVAVQDIEFPAVTIFTKEKNSTQRKVDFFVVFHVLFDYNFFCRQVLL